MKRSDLAGREKDTEFSKAVIAAHLVDVELLLELTRYLPLPEGVRRRVRDAIVGVAQQAGQATTTTSISPNRPWSAIDNGRGPSAERNAWRRPVPTTIRAAW